MNLSQMKNIIVLKDIPSNIVDEAIIILKNNANVKSKVTDNKSNDSDSNNYDFVVNEAENVIKDYIKSIEKTKDNKLCSNRIISKYRKLQITSFLLGFLAIVGILVGIIK